MSQDVSPRGEENKNNMELQYSIQNKNSKVYNNNTFDIVPVQDNFSETDISQDTTRNSQKISDVKERFKRRQQHLAQLGKRQLDKAVLNLPNAQTPFSINETKSFEALDYVPSTFQRGSESSTISNFILSQTKLRKLNEDRNKAQQRMLEKLGDSQLKDLLQQVQNAARQQEEFNNQSYQREANQFMEDATSHMQYLDQQISGLISSMNDFSSKSYEEIKNLSQTTKELFIWYFNNNQNDTLKISQQISTQKGKQDELFQLIQMLDSTLDTIMSKLDEAFDSSQNQELIRQVTELNQNVISYFKQQISTLYQHIKFNKETYEKEIQQVSDLLIEKNFSLETKIEKQQSTMEDLSQTIIALMRQVQELDKQVKVSYFSSNLLIDQDALVKQGLQEANLKQANVLDLLQQNNNLIQQSFSNPQIKEEVAKQFKDSVQSMKLDKKYKVELPNVSKIPEFMDYDNTDANERMDVESRVYDNNRAQYDKNVEEFFKSYPKQSFFFMQQESKAAESSKQANEIIQNLMNQVKDSEIPQVEKTPSPKILPKPRSSVNNIPRPEAQPNVQDNFNYNKLRDQIANITATNNAPRYVGVENRHYHKFQFKEKFDRRTHPKIFLLQFDTLAEQCGLTDEEKCMQFMFTLQGEYLDWYKARYLNQISKPTWHQLKQAFLVTYTKSEGDARDELFRITQRSGETAMAFLLRLREVVNTSDLSDDHIKNQFCFGLSNQRAKSFIYNMKMFNFDLYNQHTTTTLLQELEKQAKIFNYDLLGRIGEKKIEKVIKNNRQQQQRRPQQYRQQPYYSQNQTTQKYPSGTQSQTNTKQTYTQNYKPNQQKSNYKKPQNQYSSQHKVNFIEDQNQEQDAQDEVVEDQHEQEYTYDAAQDFEEVEEQSIHASQQQSVDEHEDISTMIIAGPSIPVTAQINTLGPSKEIQAGEGEQVHSLFRTNQKNTENLTDKLAELVKKGKKLNKFDYKSIRQMMYLHLPDEQLLSEAPKQFLSACRFLLECLDSEDNLLKTSYTQQQFQKAISSLEHRLLDLQDKGDKNSNIAQKGSLTENTTQMCANMIDNISSQAVISVNPIDYLFYIRIKFQGKIITALVDTGSTVTVISKSFCEKNNISIPPCDTKRQVTLANGNMTEMKEWKGAKITLDEYNSITCDVLISESKTYEMLFGLNACLGIGAHLTTEHLRYSIKIDGKLRFGKLPLIQKVKLRNEKRLV